MRTPYATHLFLIVLMLILGGAIVLRLVRTSPPPVVSHEGFPAVLLSNDVLRMWVYLPDAQHGYYRARRFDASGIIGDVEYAGHRFFAPFRLPHDPEGNDDVSGPAEEFSILTPISYDEAQVGEPFMKIGVGRLRRMDRGPYSFSAAYPWVEAGTWRITRGPRFVQFAQDLQHNDYAYHYVKRIELPAHEPVFLLHHTLKNIGQRRLTAAQYCHNFINIDQAPAGPDYQLEFSFPVSAKNMKGHLALNDGRLSLTAPFGEKDTAYAEFADVPAVPGSYGLTVRSARSGAGVKITSDTAPTRYNFYVASRAVCPEPYIDLALEPGQEMRWTTRYAFFVAPR